VPFLGRLQASAEEVALRFVASEGERGTEMLLRGIEAFAAKLELTEGGPIKWVRIETITITDSLDLRNSPIRPISLRDRDRPVEGDDGRGANHHQCVIQKRDLRPAAWTDAIAASR